MLHVLTIVLPVFGLIVLGFAARLSGLVTDRAGEGLSEFVFAIAVPALIFKTLTAAAIPAVQPWGYWLAYFSGVAIVWTIGTVVARRWFGVDPAGGVVAGFCSAQANTVFVGVPLILEAYGREGAVPLFLLIAIHLPIMVTVGSILTEGRGANLPRLARQLATNPLLVAIVVSVAVRLADAALPGPLQAMVDLLGSAASPCALFAMGIALKRYGFGRQIELAGVVTALKLILHPALVYLFAMHVFSMPPVWAGVAVLFATAPCGLNAYLFAERYKSGVALTASAISLSTIASVVTTTVWLTILGVR
ncbi:AEC family transporter [Alsobacter sp. SYSU M60028]|uniref:AEC family transporter n=1 Tax=Alsobacter ponti TaxID=2962936 RepID=A0ABT1LI00_9HYPH|nr:AEC family transporter [Alsobacter ponti]MCP8941127.1 AEC family transporter [Alsobacter ponti]